MIERNGIFAGGDPFELTRAWMAEAAATEPADPNAMALATVGADGLPNVRIVLLKEVEPDALVFYTNYDSAKGRELAQNPKAALVLHWKTIKRQVRVRGLVEKEDGPQADEYYASRPLQSRLGAWASKQSQPLASRSALMAKVARLAASKGTHPDRPPHWGGYRIRPVEFEFWADGQFRLHDRFRWCRTSLQDEWRIDRLNP